MRSIMLAAFVIDFGVFLACLVISTPLAVLAFAGLLWIGISIPPGYSRVVGAAGPPVKAALPGPHHPSKHPAGEPPWTLTP